MRRKVGLSLFYSLISVVVCSLLFGILSELPINENVTLILSFLGVPLSYFTLNYAIRKYFNKNYSLPNKFIIMLIPLTFAITLVIYYVTLQIPHQNTISYEEVYKDKLDIPTATPTLSKTIGSQTYTLVLGDTGLNMNLNDKPVYKNNIETISSSNIIDFWPINGGKVLLLAINTHNVIKGKTQLVRINIPTLNPSETYSISTITSLEHVLYGGFRILDYNQTTDTLLVIDIGADANAIYGSIGKISQGTYSNVTDIAGGSFQKNTPRYLGYFNSRLIMARINETNNYYESVYYFDPNSLTEKIIIGKNQMPENIYSIDFVESADNPTIKLKEEKTSKDYIFNLKKQVFEN